MKQNKNIFLRELLFALIVAIFIISFSVVLTLNFRPLYYFDIDNLNIPQSTGLSEDVIKDNYDILINYNNLWGSEILSFPNFSMSKTGKIHFEEVKDVFMIFQWIFFLSLLSFIAGIVYIKRHHLIKWLKYTAAITVTLPIVLGGLIALNWKKSFQLFHQIVFNNDYWIFDEKTDPIITILPDEFFMHCAIMILICVVLGAAICVIIYKKKSKRQA